MHQSDNVALTFYLFSSSDAVERDRMHFTPKTYIARSIFALTCVTYKKLVPSMSWEVIEFFKSPYRTSALFLLCYSLVFLKVYLLFLSVHIHDVVTNKAKPFK